MIKEIAPIVLNTRFLGQELTGVQRYGREMLARFTGQVEEVRPSRRLSPVRGHLWEQLILPGKCRGRLLWSPGNSGPLSVRHQVVTIHDAGVLDHPEWFSGRFAQWYRLMLPRLARRVRKVLTVSEFSRRRVIETCRVPEERVVAVPNGVDARFQPASPEELARFRAKNKLERPYFLFLGALEPRKNVATLLKAWERLGLRDGELVLAGAEGRVFRDRGFTDLPGMTRLWGRVAEEELPTLLSGAVGFVYPSLYEGYGLPAIEAMACGCPILVSSTTSLPEVGGAAYDSATGTGTALYFDPEDAEAMAERMRELLAMDSRSRAGLTQRALTRAAEFTWERAAEATWRVLQGELS